MAQLPNMNLTHEVKSIQVIFRFFLRLIVLMIFAAFGSIGFDRSLTTLLWMATILSGMLATLSREQPLEAVLNHWDESFAYAALCCLTSGFDRAVAS